MIFSKPMQSKGPGTCVGDVQEGSSIMTVISLPQDTRTLTDKCQGAGGTYSVLVSSAEREAIRHPLRAQPCNLTRHG